MAGPQGRREQGLRYSPSWGARGQSWGAAEPRRAHPSGGQDCQQNQGEVTRGAGVMGDRKARTKACGRGGRLCGGSGHRCGHVGQAGPHWAWSEKRQPQEGFVPDLCSSGNRRRDLKAHTSPESHREKNTPSPCCGGVPCRPREPVRTEARRAHARGPAWRGQGRGPGGWLLCGGSSGRFLGTRPGS